MSYAVHCSPQWAPLWATAGGRVTGMRTYILAAVLLILLAIASFVFFRTPPPSLPSPSTTSSTTPSTTLPTMLPITSSFTLSSKAFAHNGIIPVKYTCDSNPKLSPPLEIAGVPAGAKSLVLLMDDPDIPQVVKDARGIEVFDHWMLYDIPAGTTEIPEGATVGTAGLNSGGTSGYATPCPPSAYEPSEHRYIFTLYALDAVLGIAPGATKAEVLAALMPHLIEKTEFIGRYSRK